MFNPVCLEKWIPYTLSGITFTGVVASVTISDEGTNYLNGDVLSASDSDLGGGGGSGFQYTITSNPGQVSSVDFGNSKGSDILLETY